MERAEGRQQSAGYVCRAPRIDETMQVAGVADDVQKGEEADKARDRAVEGHLLVQDAVEPPPKARMRQWKQFGQGNDVTADRQHEKDAVEVDAGRRGASHGKVGPQALANIKVFLGEMEVNESVSEEAYVNGVPQSEEEDLGSFVVEAGKASHCGL